MADLFYVIVTLIFFLLSLGFLKICDNLMEK
jgi:hypothetical protein